MSALSGTAPSPAETSQQGSRGYQYRWMVMAVVIIADVMDLLDATIANLAGPSIRADLGGSQSTLQWVLAAYTMSFAVGLVISARAGDLVGRRRMFIIGMAGFTVASLLCGLAPTAGALIAFRVLQGAVRRGDDPAGARHGEAVLPPRRPAEGVHPVRPDHGPGRSARPDPGRLPHRRRPVRHRLADDLPHQHPGRRRRHVPRGQVPARDPARPRDEARRRRLGAAGRRLGAADLPAGPGPRARLAAVVLPDDGRLRDRLRRRSWSASGAAPTR